VTVNDIKVCEGLPAVGFPSPTSKGGRPVPNPAAGNGNDSNLNNTGSNGNYWSSTPNSDNSNNAWNLNFNSSNFNRNNNNRNNGQSVRPLRALATVPPDGTSHRLLEDLYRAYLAARRHKRNKGYQIRFEMRQERELVKLRDELLERRYEPRPSSCFIIHDPKMREVFAADFRDRIVHHLFYNYTHEIFERTFIADSYSCIEGRGTHFGIERLKHHIRSCSQNWSRPCYVLKLDVKGYFMHIDRNVLLERCRAILARRVKNLHSGAARRRTYVGEASSPPRTDMGRHVPVSNTSELQGDDVFGGASYDFVDYLLEKICLLNPLADCRVVGDTAEWRKLPTDKSLFAAKEGCGLPIGNLSSQLFSNVYLGMLDDFVKRELKVKHYGRYVDDMFIVGESKEYVKSLIEPIRAFLRERLHLELSENKTRVCDARYGVEFLGAFIKPFRTYVSSRSLRRIRGHLHSITPRMNRDRAQAVVNSSLGVLSHYDSYNVRTALSAKCRFSRVGTISEDGLRFCPSPLDWAVYRSRCKTSMPCRRGGSPRQKKVGDIPDLTRQAAASTAVDILRLPFKKGIQQ